jgi:hypothetical protein
MNPERPVSALLKAQIQHLHVAHRNLPFRYQTDIYPNAIKTEGEAAEYIRQVTEGILAAHETARRTQTRSKAKRRRLLAKAAAGVEPPVQKETNLGTERKAK